MSVVLRQNPVRTNQRLILQLSGVVGSPRASAPRPPTPAGEVFERLPPGVRSPDCPNCRGADGRIKGTGRRTRRSGPARAPRGRCRGPGGSLEPANRQRTDGDNGVPWWAACAAGQAAETGRPGGGAAASPSAAGSRRTACGSVTAPRIRRGPPQRGQTRTWIANTQRRSWAQGQRRGTGAAAARASAGDGFGTMAALQRACGARSPAGTTRTARSGARAGARE
jgi:hypothetical protein